MLARRPSTRTPARRRGAAVVETAFVLLVFSMMMFGIYEYCRYLMVMHVLNNAVRDGARYAVVNGSSKPSTFDVTNYTDPGGTVWQSVKNYTIARMGGTEKQLTGFDVACYACDPTGLALTPPVIRPKSTDVTAPIVYPDPFNQSDPNRMAWNLAAFTERIAVTAKGTYRPITPSLMILPSSFSVQVTALMGSEG